MEVLGYQVGIIVFIVGASILFGERAMWIATAASGIWTLAMVFTSALMILQFLTIFIGVFIGASIRGSSDFKKIQGTAWMLIASVVIGGILYSRDQEKSNEAGSRYISSPQPPYVAPTTGLQPPYVPSNVPPSLSPAYPLYPNGDAIGRVGQDDRETQRIIEEGRRSLESFRDGGEYERMKEEGRRFMEASNAARQVCGMMPPLSDNNAAMIWSSCMRAHGL